MERPAAALAALALREAAPEEADTSAAREAVVCSVALLTRVLRCVARQKTR
jgi:hypothetical protein